MQYEYHIFDDAKLRIFFDKWYGEKGISAFPMHLHIAPELLLFLEGSAIVRSDEKEIEAHAGDIVVIESNHLHSIYSITDKCEYYYLIPEASFCKGIKHFPDKTNDPVAVGLYREIAKEYENKDLFYREVVNGYVRSLLAILARGCKENIGEKQEQSTQMQAAKAAINFMYEHFKENISIDDICREVGRSRYYLCHVFKQVTGQTMMQLLNYIRCNHANLLLHTGEYNVTQSAYASGFTNISYFSKTYVSYMGRLPSEELKK